MDARKNLKSVRTALITNIPSPYRVLQFDKVFETLGDNFCVFYCAQITKERKWNIPEIKHKHIFLKESKIENHWYNPDICKKLNEYNPDVIITSGFFPTALVSYLFSKSKRKKYIVFTDSWLHSTNQLTLLHRLLRKFIFKHSDAFICVGKKGADFVRSYGAKENQVFISPLAIDNKQYFKYAKKSEEKEYDLLFSGQFVDRKMPFFVIEIVKEVYKRRRNTSFLLIGTGPLKNKILQTLIEEKIPYTYPGFIQQSALPGYYAASKLLLFPTKDDPWGLVANEACAAGTPVITCNNAGAANDLIRHDQNGYVLPLDKEIWVDHILRVLDDKNEYERLSRNTIEIVQDYSLDNAAKGIINAIKYVSEAF